MPKYLPKDIEWFLAELIVEFTFENGDHPLVWVNTVLVNATSLEDGYEKALQLGAQHNDTYLNTDDVRVITRFRGLRNLLLVYDKLEHGAELMWEEFEDLTPGQVDEMISPKNELGVFVTHGPENMPPVRAVPPEAEGIC